MSNSIIDQQRDNADFFWVHNSWLPGPVTRYDHEADYLRMQNLGKNLIYVGNFPGMLEKVQKMIAENNGKKKSNPYYWTEMSEEK